MDWFEKRIALAGLFVAALSLTTYAPPLRIPACRLTWWNEARFEAQIRRDLPVGTSRADAQAYLHALGMNTNYIGSRGLPPFQYILSAGADYWPMHLLVQMSFGRDQRLDRIEFLRTNPNAL